MKKLQEYLNPEIEVIDMREKYDLMVGGDPNTSTQDQFARPITHHNDESDAASRHQRTVWDEDEEQ